MSAMATSVSFLMGGVSLGFGAGSFVRLGRRCAPPLPATIGAGSGSAWEKVSAAVATTRETTAIARRAS